MLDAVGFMGIQASALPEALTGVGMPHEMALAAVGRRRSDTRQDGPGGTPGSGSISEGA